MGGIDGEHGDGDGGGVFVDGGGGGVFVVGGGGFVVLVVSSWCNKFSICENMYCISSLSPNTIVRLWMQQRQVSPWASSKLHGTGL